MLETVYTSFGEIEYILMRKRIKNLNLRVKTNGEVHISAPMRMPKKEIESFLQSKASWVIKHQQQMGQQVAQTAPTHTKEECMQIFSEISERVYPLFAKVLKGEKPVLKLRQMKTRWGVCNTQKRTITLNTFLADKPYPAIEYVILHEYVHFIHPNHQAGFHAEMLRLMPDYKQRRKLLRTGEAKGLYEY